MRDISDVPSGQVVRGQTTVRSQRRRIYSPVGNDGMKLAPGAGWPPHPELCGAMRSYPDHRGLLRGLAKTARPFSLGINHLAILRQGPHGFAVRGRRHSSLDVSRPSHPASNTRDDREAPLIGKRDGVQSTTIFRKTEHEYFSQRDWTNSENSDLRKMICPTPRRAIRRRPPGYPTRYLRAHSDAHARARLHRQSNWR